MIIRPREYLWPATLAALTSAVKGVARVRVVFPDGDESFSTGMVLTPTLLLTAKETSQGERFSVDFALDSGHVAASTRALTSIEATLEVRLNTTVELARVPAPLRESADMIGGAVLRLKSPAEAPPLVLSPASAEKAARDSWIFLLSCPMGNPLVATSIGDLLDVSEPLLVHDANSERGASGAPIVNTQAQVIGIHLAWYALEGTAESPANPRNVGVSLAGLLASLREQRPDLWEEVRRFHGLQSTADVASHVEKVRALGRGDEDARRCYQRAAAVLWSFDPSTLAAFPAIKHPRTARSLLLDDVETTRAPDGSGRWSLHTDVREAALRELGSLTKMREARDANPHAESTGAQALFDRVVQHGAIAGWKDLPTQELGWLRPIVGWLGPFVPGLPATDAIDDVLALRRLLEPFESLASSAHFRDRERERDRLSQHLAAGPDEPAALVVRGAGGSGKSALVARFVLDHIGADATQRVVAAYLDFDRAALDARKPAGLFAEILRQIRLQIPFSEEASAPPTATDSSATGDASLPAKDSIPHVLRAWMPEVNRAATQVAAAVERACAESRADRFVLVLDSFEEVQYATASAEGASVAWLDALIAVCPRTRVLVLGRAPIVNFTVGGRPAASIELGPLEDGPAREVVESWVGGLGSAGTEAIDALAKAARGNPLTLRVGAELLARHGAEGIADTLRRMPAELVRGVLHDRVLERIHDPRVRALAKPGLVLRRVTPALLRDVVAPIAEVDMSAPEAATELFDALRREAFLARTDELGSLVHRPELRAITLRLITLDAPDQVRRLDAAAAEYFAREAAALPPSESGAISALRAEALYHRLRLDAPASELEALLSPGVAARLQIEPEEELPENAATWLRSKLGERLSERLTRPLAQDARRREQRDLWGDLTDRVNDRLDLATWPKEERDRIAEIARSVAERAAARGNAPDLARAYLVAAWCEELSARLPEATECLDAAIRVRLPLEPVFGAALHTHRARLASGNAGDEPIQERSYSKDAELVWTLDEPALRRDRALGRYVHGACRRFQRGVVSRALDLIGLSQEEDDIAELAALAASRTEPSRMNLLAQAYGIRDFGSDAREQWTKLLRAAIQREDSASGLAQLAEKEPGFGDAVAELWIRRGRAVLYTSTLDALGHLQARMDERVFALFTLEQLDALGASFATLATFDPDAPKKLAASLTGSHVSLPAMPSPASQLLSDLRTASSLDPGVLSAWLRGARALSVEGAPAAVPELTRVLRLLGTNIE